MPRPPDHDAPSPDPGGSASSYLASEIGALWAFIRARRGPDAAETPRADDAAPSRAALEAELAERARTDDAFRAALRENPTETIRRALAERALALRTDVTVRLHEETATTIHLVVPWDPGAGDVELDDAALDLVAGGETGAGPMLC